MAPPDPLYLVLTAKNAEKDQNVYQYGANNPRGFVDPDGLEDTDKVKLIKYRDQGCSFSDPRYLNKNNLDRVSVFVYDKKNKKDPIAMLMVSQREYDYFIHKKMGWSGTTSKDAVSNGAKAFVSGIVSSFVGDFSSVKKWKGKNQLAYWYGKAFGTILSVTIGVSNAYKKGSLDFTTFTSGKVLKYKLPVKTKFDAIMMVSVMSYLGAVSALFAETLIKGIVDSGKKKKNNIIKNKKLNKLNEKEKDNPKDEENEEIERNYKNDGLSKEHINRNMESETSWEK